MTREHHPDHQQPLSQADLRTLLARRQHSDLSLKKSGSLSRRGFLKGTAAMLVGATLANFRNKLSTLALPGPLSAKRIYLAPDDHTDYIWTADEPTYQQAFLDTLDYYLDLADSTSNKPVAYQSRWNCDGSFWMWTYEKQRTPAQFQRLISRIRDGHIGVPLNALVILPGGAPVEVVLRGLYYPGQIERRYNLRFPLAYSMENQALPYGVGALWAGAGAKYSWKGICGCGSQIPDAWDRQREIYWWVGPDGSKILMKWNSQLVQSGLNSGGRSMGGYAEAYDTAHIADYVDSDPNFLQRYAYRVIGAFGKGWDGLQTLTDEFVTAAQNQTNSNRQVIVSNEQDFFEDFEATYGASLPSLSCAFGNEWELDCASQAEVFARVKRAVEKLRSAEALATLVTLKDTAFMNGRAQARDLAWLDLGLTFEHCIGGGGPQGLTNQRIAWQRRITREIETYVDTLYDDARTALGGLIQQTGTTQRFFVFNPLSWARTDVADFVYMGAGDVHVVDLTTQADVPSQIVTLAGTTYLRILAPQVPAVGYKVFEIQSGPGQDFSTGAPTTAGNTIVENGFYRVTVTAYGAISSWQDKTQANREFVQARNGQVLNDLGAAAGVIAVENAGPVSATLVATTDATSPLQHTSRITLIRDSARLDIRNDINQNFDATFRWGFNFNLTAPDLHHEEVGAILLAKLLADGGHYSPKNARYDWLTLNHFADLTDAQFGVTLSNADCYFMQRGNSTTTTLDVTTPQIKVLAGGRDPGISNIFNQGGDSHFLQRFALQTHGGAYDQVAAMKFALEHQNPLVTGPLTGGSAYPETSYALVTLSDPRALLWALKPADDGLRAGIIARLWNLSSTPINCALTIPPDPIVSAVQTTHIETPIANLPVSNHTLSAVLAAQQIATFALTTSSLLAQPGRPVYLPLLENQMPQPSKPSGPAAEGWQAWWKWIRALLGL